MNIPLDFSAMSALASCRRKYQLMCLHGIKMPGSPQADFGSMIHKYIQAKDTGQEVDMFALAADLQEKPQFLSAATKLDATPRPKPIWVERKFSVHSINWESNIFLQGTIDRVDMYEGFLRVIEWKTSRDRNIQKVLDRYFMSLQTSFYLYIIKNYLKSELPQEAYVALENGQVYGQVTGIFISYLPVEMKSSSRIELLPHLEENVEELVKTSVMKVTRILDEMSHLVTLLQPPDGMLSGACEYCQFRSICLIRDRERMLTMIENLPCKPYNPMEHR